MSEQKNPDQPKFPRASESSDSPKKPYIKPAFRREQVFETMALACGKLHGRQRSCRHHIKRS